MPRALRNSGAEHRDGNALGREKPFDRRTLSGKRNRKAVIPGSPDDSRLLMTMEGKAKAMPPRGKPRPKAEEVKRLREWIAAGAPDDTAKTE